ncbi:MAG: AGE family epimerase/isomerase [Bacteroidota bacterium]|nr:AGE family epimerase/isomerase [Bacteroidota bacterium]
MPAVFRREMEGEWRVILDYWMQKMPDPRNGGFYGQIDDQDRVEPAAPKGLVLNSRILWAFSAAGAKAGQKEDAARYLAIAHRAYDYLLEHFVDTAYGGVYWSVNHTGEMLNGRKQVYGNAFYLYGLSEYYLATREQGVLDQAIGLFRLIERYAYDGARGGYFEAYTRDWRPLPDQRLSTKDANEKKTANTHLHVIEAYSNLYRAWPDALLKERIGDLLDVFGRHIIDARSGHLALFFDEEWSPRSALVSYGHDIEAAWLLQQCAEIIGDEGRISATRTWALKIACAAAEGLDADGGLWYEMDAGRLVREKHWWPQAEAMVGFLNAWQVSSDPVWLERSMGVWAFVKQYIRDRVRGEWFWGVGQDGRPMSGQDKAGFWKCPYHNSRACMEVSRRLSMQPDPETNPIFEI